MHYKKTMVNNSYKVFLIHESGSEVSQDSKHIPIYIMPKKDHPIKRINFINIFTAFFPAVEST